MADCAPLLLDRVDESIPESVRTAWNHSLAIYTLRGSETPVVGHHLKVSEVNGVPRWAAPGSVLAKLVGSPPRNVLRVHGWAMDQRSGTAIVVTDIPPRTLSAALPSIMTRGLASHSTVVSLIESVMEGLDQLRALEITLGSLRPANVFLSGTPTTPTPPADGAEETCRANVLLDPLSAIILSAQGNTISAMDANYEAPELKTARASNPTFESDLYAFGVLAWAIIHHPQQLPSERPLTVDPCLVLSAILAGLVTACTEPDPLRRSISGQVKLLSPARLSNFANNDRCLTVDSQDIRLISMVGHGTFGAVFLGSWNDTEVAVKVVSSVKSYRRDILRELSLTSSVAHPNIAEVYGWIEKGPELWLVMKYYPQGNLEDWLRARYEEKQLQPVGPASGGPFGWDVFFKVSIGCARALAYLAARNLVHRDVKPQNILMDGDVPALADFGQVRRLSHEWAPEFASRAVGTWEYMASELAAPGSYPLTSKADVHSLGALMKHILLWRPKASGKPPHWDPPPTVADLVASCLQRDPNDRPDARTVLRELQAMKRALQNAAPQQ